MFSTKTAQFAWKNLAVIIDGRPMISLTDIEYTISKNLEEIYGAGDTPQFLSEGNKSYAGSIELLQNEYEALVESARAQGLDDVTDMEVAITVSYIPKEAAQMAKLVVDRLTGVKFTTSGKKFSQGDTHMKVSLPFKCLRIQPQI